MKLAMRFVSLVVASLITAFAATARADLDALFKSGSLQLTKIDEYRWTKRPVLVFASSDQDAAYKRQLGILTADTEGLIERDIVVLSDVGNGAPDEVREALQIKGFEIVLIGKDGGVKLRSKTPLSLSRLFARIDAMPMRQLEMRDRPRPE